jgi:CheY-like chemotaxis protein
MPIRIFVADDHDIVREGVKSLLKSRPEWTICGEASDGTQAASLIGKIDCDIAILDISMPGKSGLEVAASVSRKHPEIKILIFTMHGGSPLSTSLRCSTIPALGSTESNQFRYPRQSAVRETRIRRSSFPPPQHSAHAACCGLVLLRRLQQQLLNVAYVRCHGFQQFWSVSPKHKFAHRESIASYLFERNLRRH